MRGYAILLVASTFALPDAARAQSVAPSATTTNAKMLVPGTGHRALTVDELFPKTVRGVTIEDHRYGRLRADVNLKEAGDSLEGSSRYRVSMYTWPGGARGSHMGQPEKLRRDGENAFSLDRLQARDALERLRHATMVPLKEHDPALTYPLGEHVTMEIRGDRDTLMLNGVYRYRGARAWEAYTTRERKGDERQPSRRFLVIGAVIDNASTLMRPHAIDSLIAVADWPEVTRVPLNFSTVDSIVIDKEHGARNEPTQKSHYRLVRMKGGYSGAGRYEAASGDATADTTIALRISTPKAKAFLKMLSSSIGTLASEGIGLVMDIHSTEDIKLFSDGRTINFGSYFGNWSVEADSLSYHLLSDAPERALTFIRPSIDARISEELVKRLRK